MSAAYESHIDFQTIVTQAQEGIWTIDASGATTYVNASMCEMLGYSAEQMMGRLHTDFMFETDRPSGDLQMELRRIGNRQVWDQRYRRKDGSELWTLANCCPLYDRGSFIGALGMFTDITQRRRLETELRESETRFRGTFENAAVGVAHVALDGRWLRVNRTLCALLGYDHSELMQLTFREITHPDDLARDLSEAERVKRGEIDTYTLEKRYRRKNGEYFWADLTVSMLHDAEGRPVHYISIVQDATPRRAALAALEARTSELIAASGAKDQFLATLSHELREPLGPVLMLSDEALEDDATPASLRPIFATIQECVAHQMTLINDLLDITRIAAGKTEVKLEPVELTDLLDRIISEQRPKALHKGVLLSFRHSGPKIWVRGDPVRLRQVFVNLVGNAVKFTPTEGSVDVEVRDEPDTKEACVSVRDTGIGLTKEELGRLFQRFAQGDHARDRPSQFGGLGLGLAISDNLVQMHGGTLSASSEGRNCGATFYVRLPTLATEVRQS